MKQLLSYTFVFALFFSCAKDDLDPQPSFESFFEETEVEDFSADMSDFERETLELINLFRADTNNCGGDIMNPTGPLKWHPNIDAAAEAHAMDMHTTGTLSHDGSDGSDIGQRLERANYKAAYWGENVAQGPTTPAQVVEAFKNSPGHCRVMSNPNFKQVGIAKVGEYWVFDFGTLQ